MGLVAGFVPQPDTKPETRSTQTTQTPPPIEEKIPLPTSRHTSLPAQSDENWNTPNLSEP